MGRAEGRARYKVLADEIKRQVDAGELRAGDKLPSENEMIEQYGVGRATVREALAVLRGDGYVVSHQGKGTFVRAGQSSQEDLVVALHAVAEALNRVAEALENKSDLGSGERGKA